MHPNRTDMLILLMRGVCWTLLIRGGATGKVVIAATASQPSSTRVVIHLGQVKTRSMQSELRHCEEGILDKEGLLILPGLQAVMNAICRIHKAALYPSNKPSCMYTDWSSWSSCPATLPQSCRDGIQVRTRKANTTLRDLCIDIKQSKLCKKGCATVPSTKVQGQAHSSSVGPNSCLLCD